MFVGSRSRFRCHGHLPFLSCDTRKASCDLGRAPRATVSLLRLASSLGRGARRAAAWNAAWSSACLSTVLLLDPCADAVTLWLEALDFLVVVAAARAVQDRDRCGFFASTSKRAAYERQESLQAYRELLLQRRNKQLMKDKRACKEIAISFAVFSFIF